MCCFCVFVGLVCDRINDETLEYLEWVSRFGFFSFRLICFACFLFVCSGLFCFVCVSLFVCFFFLIPHLSGEGC